MEMENKIRLELLGITGNQVEPGVYAVVLQQTGGTRRIPIIIGASEAQSIQCKLQDVRTPRPLTHDLLANMMRAFGIALKEVHLKKLPNGIFAADLMLTDGDREIAMDSRSSDAVALAVRVGAPIFTTPDVLEEAGFEPDEIRSRHQPVAERYVPSLEELQEAMEAAVEREDYEEAARIKRQIEERSSGEKVE